MNIDWEAAKKSKTVKSLVLIIVVVLMQMFGVGQPEVAETIDTMGEIEGQGAQMLMNIILLVLTGTAGFGRVVAKKPLVKKEGD